MNKKEKLTPRQAILKAANYCAYQERCHAEVNEKLAEWGLYGDDAANVVYELIRQNYLNEERFAKAYAGGKFRQKKWGRVKIRLELKAREVSDVCIREGLKEINEDEYREVLKELAIDKLGEIKKEILPAMKNKVARYLAGKGYEADLVWETLREIAK